MNSEWSHAAVHSYLNQLPLSGSSVTLISNPQAMLTLLKVLGDLACHGGWDAHPSTDSRPHHGRWNSGSHIQHSCEAAPKWEDHTVTFLFKDGGRSAALPVNNFFSVSESGSSQVLHLLVLSSSKAHQPSVLGKQFFANQWVEFDESGKLRVGFRAATSAKDKWGCVRTCTCTCTHTDR